MQAISDRTNPIVVKELRQAVQSRLVIAILLLFLLANVLVVGGYLMLSVDATTSERAGPELFSALFVVLVGTCMIFVPLVCRGSFDDGAERLEHRLAVHHHDSAGRDHPRQVLGGRGADGADLQRRHCPF